MEDIRERNKRAQDYINLLRARRADRANRMNDMISDGIVYAMVPVFLLVVTAAVMAMFYL
jgi:hypothetical protein